MSLNNEYSTQMDNVVNGLVENSAYDKATNHVVYDASKLELPKGVTEESMKTHIGFINELSGAAEVATAQIARDQYAENDKLTTVDGTLSFGGFNINSQHHLKQQVGEDHIYGGSTTAVDYIHSSEQAEWLDTQREANSQAAAKLFG